MERNQIDGQHDYHLEPSSYPINDNNRPATYDQFIQLRDTLIFTGKYYNNKASRKLCVGDKGDGTTTNTIEVREPRIFRQGFEPNRKTSPDSDITTKILPSETTIGRYIDYVPEEIMNQYNFPRLSCLVKKDGRYRIIHKEEILLDPTTNKVCCYVDIYQKDDFGNYVIPQDKKGGVAVFDWEGGREDDNTHYKKTFSITNGRISGQCHGKGGGSVDGTCSGNVVVQFTLGDIIHKMTSFGYMERDLQKDDILVLRMRDKGADESTGEPQGNDLKLQNYSNYRSIEYMDLPYKTN